MKRSFLFWRRRLAPRKPPARPRLQIETLEDRSLPSSGLSASLVADIVPGPDSSGPGRLTNVNGTLFFGAASGLWKSDGTAAGTVLVADVPAGGLTSVNGRLFFSSTGGDLWTSDGTTAGTVLLKEFNSGDGHSVQSLTGVGGTLFFVGYDTTTGYELWKSDGTAAGTVLVKDIYTGGTTYQTGSGKVGHLKITIPHSSNPSSLTNVNGTLYFAAYDGTDGAELWKSDGTAAGTVMVKDISPRSGSSSPNDLINVNGLLYFMADDGTHGQELWRTDGTAGGTVLVNDINPGSASAFGWGEEPAPANVNGTLYFVADDGTHGRELWNSDGTAAGTVLVNDINPGSANSSAACLTNANGTLFFIADDGVHGAELWKSNGTAAGTVLVKDIIPGSGTTFFNNPEPNGQLTNVNGLVYFVADNGTNGSELWQSDGTAAGTLMVQDIYPGGTGSNPSDLTSMNNKLYFAATDPIHGTELWDPPPVVPANIDVSNDSHVQRETSIDVNPVNSLNLVAAATDESNGNTAYFSRDGGNTWKTSGLLPLKVEGTTFWTTADPVVAFDTRGSVYVAYNAFDKVWPQPKGHGAIAVAKSTDGGESWTQVTTVEFNPNTDHPKIAVDKDPASPYRDTVYVTWKHFFGSGTVGSSFDVLRSRSTDGGLTWSAPVDISDDPGQTWFNAAAIGPEGNVYASWIGAINPAGGATQFVDRSTDGGVTFGSDLAVTTINTDDVGQGAAFSSPAQPNNFNGLSLIAAQASLDTDRSPGRFRGRVYLAYADRPDPTLRPFDMDIYLQFSDDQARTWSPRIRVNDDGAGNSQFFPSLSVDPQNGTVVISWYDTRRDPASLQKTDVFLAVGTPTNHGVSFRPNLRVTDEQSDESTNNKQAKGTYGDYEGLVAFGGVAHPVWTDARVSNFPPRGSLREEVYTAAIRYAGGADLLAASLGHISPDARLASQQVGSLLPEASVRWQAAGVATAAVPGIDIRMGDLSGATLGRALAHTIWLDLTAAGWPWLVDGRSGEDPEITTRGNRDEQSGIDLLTAEWCELGHEHQADGLVADTLAADTRLMPGRAHDVQASLSAADALLARLSVDAETA
jgi:ELWxxDGT repeat protein